MSYHKRYAGRALAPRAMSGVSTQFASPRSRRPGMALGSLGVDDTGGTTLSNPTITDPATAQWQATVLAQLQEGVASMKRQELPKWLAVIATVMIPVSAAIWKGIFKRGAAGISSTGV